MTSHAPRAALLGLALLSPAVAVPLVHPKDGPDADVRVRIEDAAVRFDVFLNLVFADEIVEVPRAEQARLAMEEQAALRSALFEHLRRVNAVEIDGVAVQPIDDGFEFFEAEEGALALFPTFGPRAAARVRLALVYPLKAPPEEVALTWGAYPPDLALATAAGAPLVEVQALLVAGAEERQVSFSASEPRHVWRRAASTSARLLSVPEAPDENRTTLPGLSLGLGALLLASGAAAFGTQRGRRARRTFALAAPFVLAAAVSARGAWPIELPASAPPLPTEAQALAVFAPLHANIYRAFDYTAESDVYDALAQSVAGELLDRLYGEIYRSLVLQEAGGAVARVQSVALLETDIESIERVPATGAPAFTVLARWRVEGSVHHWGHAHARTNEHRARYRVVAGHSGWRIAASEVLEQTRVGAEPVAGPPDGPVSGASAR